MRVNKNSGLSFGFYFSLFFLVIFSVLVLQAMVLAGPTLSEVLAKETIADKRPPAPAYWVLAAAFFATFAALSFKGYDFLRKNTKDKSFGMLVFPSKEEESLKIKKEMKELLFKNEELSRENVRLLECKEDVVEEKQKLEEVVQSRMIAEELLKKSNESLRRAYDKLLAEKETLVLKMNQGDFSAAMEEEGGNRPLERKAELKAVEDLINEVGEVISSKHKTTKKKNKAVNKKGKKRAVSRKEGAKRRKKR